MPTFDIAIIGAPEQIPGCFINLDFRSAAGSVQSSAGSLTSVVNTSPPSVLAKAQNDKIISPWWDPSIVGTVGYDGTIYDGAGAIQINTAGNALSIAHSDAPTLLAPQNYTFWVVATHAVSSDPAFIFTDTGATNTLQFSIDNPASSHHVTYRGASGPIDTGVAASSGLHFYGLTLNSSPQVQLFRDSITPVFTGTNYAGTRLGGYGAHMFVGDDGTSGEWFHGNMGHFMLFNRAITLAEMALLLDVESTRFNLPIYPGTYQHAAPVVQTFTDPPAGDGRPSRINPTDGYPEKYISIHRGPYSFVDVVALPIRYGGFLDPVDPSAGYVPHFVEWPKMKTTTEPPTFSIAGDPSGVCRLRLRDYGRYGFALYKPTAGMQIVYFNLEP